MTKGVFTSIKRKIKSRKFKANYYVFSIVLGIAWFIFSTWMFWNAFHSMDIGQNVRFINAKYDLELYEVVGGIELDGAEMYQLGVIQNIFAFLSVIYASVFTTVAVGSLYNLAIKNDKEN